MAAPRVANCIFCDDIRPELGGKFSIMGVYASDMIFPVSPPASILKWGIVVWLVSDIDDVPEKFTIRVLIPPDKIEITSVEIDRPSTLVNPEGVTKYTLRSIMPLPPVNFTQEGFVEVMIDTDREPLRAGRLFVQFLPPASTDAPTAALPSDEPAP
jgi:hypothetical protein